MGRKFKWIIIGLMILGLSYCQLSFWGNVVSAKEEEFVDDEESADENEEKIEKFQLAIPPEDGKNGYYVTRPEVELCHVSKVGVTKYCFTDSNGQSMEGVLSQENEKASIEKERFQEGKNHLSVWMEDAEGNRLEESSVEKDFLIDTKAPTLYLQTPRGEGSWYQKEVVLKASAEDGEQGSQINWLSCTSGDRVLGGTSESMADFRIHLESTAGEAVYVTVGVTDRAGNYTEKSCKLYIDHHSPQTMIEGIQNYMITSQPVEVTYRVTEDNLIRKASACAKRKDPAGNMTVLEVTDWFESGNEYSAKQFLTEDGIYQLGVKAADYAGYEDNNEAQVIIDKENPVIRYVDRLHQQYLKSFCWNYPIEEWILDFTSYTYSVSLDGKLYHLGEEILAEGGHILDVKAIDSAGNIGTAKAYFVIDHTAPQVVFSNLEDEKTYEEEKDFQITLSNQEDFIKEIRINGEVQKTNSRSKIYQYTVQEYRNYEIIVKAYDRAGNQTTERISFDIVPKETAFQKITRPMREKIVPSQKKEQKENKPSVQASFVKKLCFIGIGILILMIGSVMIGWAVKQRRNLKKEL